MRTTLACALALLAGAPHLALAQEKTSAPNIVFILADDLGWGDVKCFGGEKCRIRTPHLDALAAAGMKFTDANSVAAVCVPSRVGIMTGRYPWRFRSPNPDGPWGYLNPRLAVDGFTLARMLRQVGYLTGYVGKWHLGTLMRTKDGKNQGPDNTDHTRPLKIGPRDFGFDFSFILPGSLDMFPYAFVRDHEWVGSITARKGCSAFNRVGPAASDFEYEQVLDVLATRSEEFIAARAARARKGQPFFLYLGLTSPHTPLCVSEPFKGKSELGLYGDFVMETDHAVGRVLAALKKHGLEKDTLVIFSSDHGPAPLAGNEVRPRPGQLWDLQKLGHFASGPFRGGKFSILQGAFRVPFLVRWPARVPAGKTCERLIALIDLPRTLAEVAGAKVPAAAAPDSFSFAALLRNPEAKGARTDLVYRSSQAFAVRKGNLKLALCAGAGCNGAWGNQPAEKEAWKKALADFGKKPTREDLGRAPFVQLYDLAADPGERKNLAAARREAVDDLRAHLEGLVARGRSTAGPELPNDVERIDILRK